MLGGRLSDVREEALVKNHISCKLAGSAISSLRLRAHTRRGGEGLVKSVMPYLLRKCDGQKKNNGGIANSAAKKEQQKPIQELDHNEMCF